MSFALWNPALSEAGDAISFDVTPGDGMLADGTVELMRGCLAALGLPEPEPSTWEIQPYRSPYYAATGDENLDHALAWRVRLRFAEPTRLRPVLRATAPTEADVFDRTWLFTPGERARFTRDVVVIGTWNASAFSWREKALRQALDAYEAVEIGPLDAWWTQVRIPLGALDLPADLPVLARAKETLRAHGGAVHWRDLA